MTFVVAEIGVNWNGNFKLVQEMIENAKKAGCNAVKFQSFNESIVKEHPDKELLLKTSISKDNIDEIDGIAKKAGIEWFSTPMYPEAVTLLNPYVSKYKIRNFDGEQLVKNHTSEIIKKVLDTGKEIIISSHIDPSSCKIYNNEKI